MNKLFAIIAAFGLAFVFAGCPSSGKSDSVKTDDKTKTDMPKTDDKTKTDAKTS